MMLVVSDTSPLTALLQIGQADLLPTLFDQVIIPPTVRDELLRFHESLPGFLVVKAIQDQSAVEALNQELDLGEAEAIVLAEESHADCVLMDEKRGRTVAKRRGLNVVGLLGVLLKAKKTGRISSMEWLIGELESRAGFYVSEAVKQIVLAEAGESKY